MGAKKSTKINGAYEKKCAHLIAGQQRKIGHIYDQACDEAADIASFVGSLADGEGFSFSSPLTKRKAKQMLTRLKNDLQAVLVDGVNSAWTLANNKNNELARAVFGANIGKLSKGAYSRYFSTNDAAREAFLARKANGLGLSERVWELAGNFEQLIERGVEYGIRTGADATKMARGLKLYLQHPDELFRRVRDKKSGNLKLSENAKAFSPGRGVYRSSYKNALRLARTETNMAYRTADFERINQLDFVVGIKVVLSNNHTSLGADGKAHDLYDICDELQGKYPKDFKFVGWHPHCRCHVETILKTDEELDADNARILNGEEPQSGSVNEVKQVPANFKDWLENNIERAKGRASLPYFIADNINYIDNALKNKNVNLLIPKLGDVFLLGRAEEKLANKMYKVPANNPKNKYTKKQVENHKAVEQALGISKGKDMSHQDANTGNVNIDGKGKKAGDEYKENCQCCVVTYELRRRGFNVKAAPHFNKKETIPYQLGEGTISAWIGAKRIEIKPQKGVVLKKDLNANTQAVGRYHIEWNWKNETYGHIVTVERLPNRELVIYDPQDSSYRSLDFLNNTEDGLVITRVDNLIFNTKVISEVVRVVQK